MTPSAPVADPPPAAQPASPIAIPFERLGRAIREPRGIETLSSEEKSGDWPNTTRVLPWLLAAFIALLWLVPFNTISMTVSLPFQLRLDRIVLPVIVLVWILTIAAGSANAPRLRVTPIHGAIGLFIGIAFLSDVLDARYLNQTLELTEAIKQLALLLAYGFLFVVVASSVRRTEVRAFLTYTLLLAVICGIGTLWEYRYKTNVFYSWSAALLPSAFHVPTVDATAVDDIGRRLVTGPAEIGLETAAMLTMALPIALVRLFEARGFKRVVYTLAAGVLLAATISTYKKTALIAPAVVFVVIGFFRPRDVIKLVPLLLILAALVHVLSPGAFGSITEQLQGNRLTSVSTTSHRTAAYDAVRPDVWSHPLIGRGYGSYDQVRNRILDDSALDLLIGVGILGLAAFLGMIVSVIVAARPLIRGPDRDRAPAALAIAAAAAVFLTVSFLYDSMAFPHGPYIFITLAAFLAVMIGAPAGKPGQDAAGEPRRGTATERHRATVRKLRRAPLIGRST